MSKRMPETKSESLFLEYCNLRGYVAKRLSAPTDGGRFPDYEVNLSICYERTGNIEIGNIKKAEAAYQKAIEIDPNYAEAWFNLGGYYWNQGDTVNAYSTWEVAMQKFPKHPDCDRVRILLVDPYKKK
jgi:tetratricopeptide (TPR) repeat protein